VRFGRTGVTLAAQQPRFFTAVKTLRDLTFFSVFSVLNL
jgi:hypothetical protein